MEIVHLDLTAVTSRLLFSLDPQFSNYDNSLIHPKICGDLAAVVVNLGDEIIVVNWKTESFFRFPIPAVCYQFH